HRVVRGLLRRVDLLRQNPYSGLRQTRPLYPIGGLSRRTLCGHRSASHRAAAHLAGRGRGCPFDGAQLRHSTLCPAARQADCAEACGYGCRASYGLCSGRCFRSIWQLTFNPLSAAAPKIGGMNLQYFLFRLWEIVVDHAIPLIALLLLAILVPRLGRLTIRIIEGRIDEEEESTKSRLALLGALVYVIQIVAFFLIILLALSNLGVPPLGAAVPATIVSAAVGFGAQSIIGDFLSGFFILSERQFGVGDYVS